MGLLSEILQSPLLGLALDQRLGDLLKKGEVRITEERLQQELQRRPLPALAAPKIALSAGKLEISGEIRKRFLPRIPFAVRFSVHSLQYGRRTRNVSLRIDGMRPFNSPWVNRRIADSLGFAAYDRGIVTVDLERIPPLAELFAREVQGIRIFDYLALEEIAFRPGEIVGRIGVCR